MNTPTVSRSLVAGACLATLLAASTTPATAAVVVDPTLGPLIDPSGSNAITVAAPDSVNKTTLEAMAGFGVLHTFTGFAAPSTTVSFTDPQKTDLQISFTEGPANNGNETTSTAFSTSGASALLFAALSTAPAQTIRGVIDFGAWGGTSFDTDGGAASAAGFTLSGQHSRFTRVESLTATFYSTTGSVLSTQSVGLTDLVGTGNQGIYFGYQAEPGQSIGSIEIVTAIRASAGCATQFLLGLDDIGFVTAIPEPSSAALMVGGMALVGAAMNRRVRR